MRRFTNLAPVLALAVLVLAHPAAAQRAPERETYERVPMPAGFQVISTDLEGPVFADANGRTLYTWPRGGQRNGDAGEQQGRPTCEDTKYTETAGLMSPYPAGLELPELDTRPTCVQLWPPVMASAEAKPVGKWTVVDRKDGAKQWAYDGYALYTSVLDEMPGDTRGGRRGRSGGNGGDGGTPRIVAAPPTDIPAQFGIFSVRSGRMVGLSSGFSVYTYDKDTATKSSCSGICLRDWTPVLAGETATAKGDWSIVEREPGVKQWAFRKKLLYTRVADDSARSLEGSDEAGWSNVYAQKAPAYPTGFKVQDSYAGQVLADARGHTVYIYNCIDDTFDQHSCDHPGAPQAYRLAVCGGGDAARCLATFPYVLAPKDAKSGSRAWTAIDIDPKTGRHAAPGQSDALHVWAYRGRPVFTFVGDKKPGQVGADGWGEFHGARNGFKAFSIRDDFKGNAG
jgi:predicted lipoprotein with Yx(FWY)xxD motif